MFCSSRRRDTRLQGDWSSDVCSSDLLEAGVVAAQDVNGLTRARAFVVLNAGWKASEELAATLIEFVRKRGAGYKAPAAVDFVEDRKSVVKGRRIVVEGLSMERRTRWV